MLMAIIGKCFEDGGLRGLAIESGIIAEGSVKGVMEGKHYNRAVRFHKLTYEVCMRLIWNGFMRWDKHEDETSKLLTTIGDLLSEEELSYNFKKVLTMQEMNAIYRSFNLYMDELKLRSSMSAYWMSYVNLVSILLDLIRASREGYWKLHLSTIEDIIPWCFSYNRTGHTLITVFITD